MRLVLVRHGKAEDPERFSKSGHADELRPLSPDGRRDLRRAAGALAKLLGHVDQMVTSPLVRAVETTAVLVRSFPKLRPTEAAELKPGVKLASLTKWLEATCGKSDETIMLIGHEPSLSRLATLLLSGRSGSESFIAIKRGGACLIDFPAKPAAGHAVLRWLLTPRQLRGRIRH